VIGSQLVTWTLLPNGLTDDGQLSASVFIAPRLRPDPAATLSDFPDFLDWPATLQGLGLEIVRPDGTAEAPTAVMVNASSSLWAALFPPSTAVKAFRFDDLADRPIISYDVAQVLAYLRGRWAAVAGGNPFELPVTNSHASPVGGPPVTPGQGHAGTLAAHFTELRSVLNRGIYEDVHDPGDLSARVRAGFDDASQQARVLRQAHNLDDQDLILPFLGHPAANPPGPPALTDSLYAFSVFHARPSLEEPRGFPGTREDAVTELAEGYDFHHYLSLLGDHPALLRRLGLVIDLVLRPELVGATTEADPATMLRLRVRRNSAFPSREGGAQPWNADVTPAVACRLSDVSGQAVFRAVERGTRHDFNYGLLHLGQDRYTVAAVDVDGLGLKAMNLAATLQRQDASEQRPVEEPASDGIPTVRTGGVALIQTGKAADLHADFYQARRHNDALETDPANPHDLAAEDLIRGYRLDVLTGGTWRSLHQRNIRYAMDRAPGEAFDILDEGHAQLGVTADVDRPDAPADPDRPLYVHETLATWDGWSLAVPRPGHPIAQDPEVPAAGGDLTSLGLTITTTPVPGSLPRLRYLSGYRLRVRPVDLAGNALRPADANLMLPILEAAADPALRSAIPPEPLIYRRFEPVPAPELLPRRPFGPGEGLERLVIRSTPGVAAADYAAASQSSPTLSLRFYPTCDRHLAAPRASLQMVETHGLLDEAIDAVRNMADADAAAAAAAPLYAVATRENGSFRDDPAAKVVKTGDHAGQPNGYVYLDVDQVELPYLPDPLGAGVRVRVEFDPQQPPQVLEAAFPREAGDWYRLQPLRLRLEEGPGSAGYDPAERLVTIALPPGHSARLRLSSLFHGDPEIFGLVDWCRQEPELNNADQVLESVRDGTHWMTTPWRDLILIHAVQRPVRPAELMLDLPAVPGFAGPLTLPRRPGETVAPLNGALRLDQASTAEIDLRATWDEVQDDPLVRCEDPAEMVRQRSHQVFALSIPEPFGTPWQADVAPFIEVLSENTLGFRTSADDERPEQRRAALLEAAAAAGLSAPARRRLEGAATQLEKLHGHDLGDTRYRQVSYQAVAATRFREYFDPQLPAEDGQQAGRLWAVDVLSCAAPAKPAVLRVLPLMGYEQTATAGTALSHRRSLGCGSGSTGPGSPPALESCWRLSAIAAARSPPTPTCRGRSPPSCKTQRTRR
jgi:hypothetical protein